MHDSTKKLKNLKSKMKFAWIFEPTYFKKLLSLIKGCLKKAYFSRTKFLFSSNGQIFDLLKRNVILSCQFNDRWSWVCDLDHAYLFAYPELLILLWMQVSHSLYLFLSPPSFLCIVLIVYSTCANTVHPNAPILGVLASPWAPTKNWRFWIGPFWERLPLEFFSFM